MSGAALKDDEAKKKRRQDRHRTLERIRRDKTQALLASIQAELAKRTGQKPTGEVTLNKTLKHIVQHVRAIREEEQAAEANGEAFSMSTSTDKTEPSDDPERLAMLAVMNCDTPLAILHMHGGIVDANDAFCQALGFTAAELIKNTIYVLTAPDDLACLMKEMCSILTNDETQNSVSIPGVKLIHNMGHFVTFDLDVTMHQGTQPCYTLWATPEHHDQTYASESAAAEELRHVLPDHRVSRLFVLEDSNHKVQKIGGVGDGAASRVPADLSIQVPQYHNPQTGGAHPVCAHSHAPLNMVPLPVLGQPSPAGALSAGLPSWDVAHHDMLAQTPLLSPGAEFATPMGHEASGMEFG
eukprot:CAMPEP_0169453162 /NCGR_PEP_ID=MMETSP1042-20121227/14617_1 /TAXON_ID=464988 /ORGANISM="Hemiselmis andersenii, Strain CCMP1180" /LENGTH=353 /DNA_ID=CAMNT_0009565189 /DNA_START=120 /DNA_END=1177 /DNA_ORIENTATION=-